MSLLDRMQRQNTQDDDEGKKPADSQASGVQPLPELLSDSAPRQTSRLDMNTLTTVHETRMREMKKRIQYRLIAELRPLKKKLPDKKKDRAKDSKDKEKDVEARPQKENRAEFEARILDLFNQILAEERMSLNRRDRQKMFDEVVAEILGFGPLEKLLADEPTTDILVLGPDKVFVERGGKLFLTDVCFDSEEHVQHVIDRILGPLGRRVDETSPMVDARLPDGSRVNAVIKPVALDGPYLTIRKFAPIPLVADDLVRLGTSTDDLFEYLFASVSSGLNILVTGGSSCGKTTLLNVLSAFIRPEERIVTIENAAELQLQQAHVVRLETRQANIEGEGEMDLRELVINSLRMRPDRIIVGEVRGSEALDLLQAMNTGHEGSMGTIHANSPTDALTRLETMCVMSGMDLPLRAIREQIAAAVDLVIHMARLRDGTRKILYVTEIEGMEGDSIRTSDIFAWERRGVDNEGNLLGALRATGIVPRSIVKLQDAGFNLRPNIFDVDSLETTRQRKVFIPAPDEEEEVEIHGPPDSSSHTEPPPSSPSPPSSPDSPAS